LILKTLALEPMHGYGVALRIEQVSKGVFRVNPGSLLPALARMERAGRITFRYAGGAANGAMRDAAAVCNEAGNVLALMPHPERAAWAFNLAFADASLRGVDPASQTPALQIFRSMAASLARQIA